MLRHELPARGADAMKLVEAFPVVIAGAGAIGSNLALTLSKQGFQHISVIDFDRVELHNIGTQVYGPENVGALKVDALKNIVWQASEVDLVVHSKRLDESNIKKLLKGQLVVDAFDNSKSRELLYRNSSLPCVHAGFNGMYGEIRWNERYIVPSDDGEDICEYPLARNLVTLLVSVLAEVVIRFAINGEKINKAITFKDLRIHDD